MLTLPLVDGYVSEEIRHLDAERRRHDPAHDHRAEQRESRSHSRQPVSKAFPSPAGPERGPGGEAAPPIEFTLPRELEASGPPERRGLRRDQVRLLVLNRSSGATLHTRFDRIGEVL